MSKTRQLAAIMFTDIVGFTSLMGSDEQKTLEILEANRKIHKSIINEYNGTWIKELGDGVIASFNGVSDAVNAAIKIQETCNASKDYSLRIGIHQGEIVFEADDVFGDGVNIAARIQSAAEPGCIFISESVNNNFSNKSHIETHFIKEEKLKNVSQPIRLYQVLFKGSERILPQKQTAQKTTKKRLIYFVALSVILISLFMVLKLKNAFGGEKILSNDKIAVLEFTNNTNDNELDIIGKITANWIIHGITEKEVGQVISPKLVNDYASVVKSEAGAVDLTNLLKNYFNPGKVIEGGFYTEKNRLLLQGSIRDGQTDKTLISFETINCNPSSPLDCVEELKQKILGYFTVQEDTVRYWERTPPKFNAVVYNQNAMDNLNNDKVFLDYLEKAIKADSNFLQPKIHRIAYYYNKEQYKTADSLRKLANIKSKLSERQQNILLFYESILSGKNDKAYRAHKKEYKKAYKDMATNMSEMTIALQIVNRPEDIKQIFNEIPMDNMVLENCVRCGYRYYLKGLADVELGNYNDVISMLVPITNIIEYNYLKRPLISAFVKSEKLTELENYLSDYNLTAETNDIDYLSNFTGIQLINANQIEEANKYFNKIITRNNNPPSKVNLAKATYFKGAYPNSEVHYKALIDKEPNNIEYLVHLAISYFKNRKFEEAKTTIEKLDNLRTDYQFGAIDYGWAQYYNSIGDRAKALEFLQKSVAQGFNYTPSTFQNDPHFRTLKNSPQFTSQIMNYWKNKLK